MSDDRKNGVTTGAKPRAGAFPPGNPGRPLGARNKATLAAQALLEGGMMAVHENLGTAR